MHRLTRFSAVVCLIMLAALLAVRAQTSAPLKDVKDDYSQEPGVIEEMVTKIAFDNDGNSTREQVGRLRVQTDAGVKQWGLLKFPFQSATQTVDIDYVRVRKPDGSTVTTPPDNVQDLDAEITRSAPFYSDLREKHVAVKGLGKGDILEYVAHWRSTKPLVPGQFWFQYSFQRDAIVLAERLEISVPAARAVKVKGPQASQTVSTEAGSRIYAWTYSRLKNTKDPEGDQKKETEAALGRLPAPDVQISSFQNWEEVGRWYWNLQKDRIDPSPAIRAKAVELTKGMTDDAAKMRAIYSFVSTQYRYIGIAFGIGRYQPHAADDVLTNNYGDCKDKHTLLASLLEASGITLYPALINSSFQLDPDVPSPAQFDHIIGYLPMGKDKDKDGKDNDAVWLDSTVEVAPFGYLYTRLRDKQALLMEGEKSIRLVTTPADPPFPSTTVFKISGQLSDDGSLEAKVVDTIRGDGEVLVRVAFRQVPQSQWKELVQQISYGLGYSGTVSEVSANAPEAASEPFQFSYSYSRKDYPDWSNRQFFVPGLPFYMPPVKDDAKYPIWLGSPTETVSDSTVELPKGYRPKLPASVDLKYDFAEYHASYSLDNDVLLGRDVLLAKRRFVSKLHEVPVAEFDDYRSLVKNMQNDVNQYVQTSRSSHEGDLEKRAREAVENGEFQSAVTMLKSAVEADPQSTTAWNNLGLAYLRLKEYDLASAAFQKQIEINPHDSYAYNNLGRVYLAQRKYDDAASWFKKQTAIDPQDRYSHANLGITLMRQHKYEEATPELEKALSLAPKESSYELQLGIDYLNLGQDEKAMTAFDKAIKLSDTPNTWNSVAYELSLKKAHTDIARRYAESAVASLTANLRNVSLAQLKRQDFATTALLGACWDTLGWVEFAGGDLQKAKKYVLAAWQLGEHAEEADHLGQIYEKLGDTEQAMHFYAVAMNGPDPEPETRPRLVNLAGQNEKVDTMIDKARDELTAQRTIKIANRNKLDGKADFIVLLVTGPGTGMSAEEVKYVSGDEKLKPLIGELRAAQYAQTAPDEIIVRILRRGTLSCAAASADCTFLLALPQDVKSVD